MTTLKVLKDMVLNGKLIAAGEYVQTENPKLFLTHNLARRLTREETRAILNSYVEYAVKVFADSPKFREQKRRVCGDEERRGTYGNSRMGSYHQF